jgi:hypothetical protein
LTRWRSLWRRPGLWARKINSAQRLLVQTNSFGCGKDLKMHTLRKFGYAFASFLVVCLLSLPAVAQKGKSGSTAPPPGQTNKNSEGNNPHNQTSGPNSNSGNSKAANEERRANLPPKFVENLQDMSPEQQERFMKNNERFKNMSPQQQAQIRQRLQHWNSMTPQQRIQWRQRNEILQSMTPKERQYVQQQVIPMWNAMPRTRRVVMMQHLHQLDGLSDSEREAKLNDPAFTQGLNPDEKVMLPYLSRLRIGTTPEPPPGPPEY